MALTLDINARTDGAQRNISSLSSVIQTGLGTAIGFLSASALPRLGAAIGEAVDRASELGPLSQGFENLAGTIGTTGDAMLGKLRPATLGMVSDFELMKQANNAMILGVAQSDDQFATLAEAATKLGRAVGLDATSSIESLTVGIGRQSRMMLDNLGVIVSAEQAYEAYAQKVGKATSELTDQEKKLAFTEAATLAVVEAAERLGDVQLTAADRIKQVNTAASNLKDAFIQAAFGSDALTDSFERLAGRGGQGGSGIGFARWAGDKFATFLTRFQFIPGLSAENLGILAESFDRVGGSAEEAGVTITETLRGDVIPFGDHLRGRHHEAMFQAIRDAAEMDAAVRRLADGLDIGALSLGEFDDTLDELDFTPFTRPEVFDDFTLDIDEATDALGEFDDTLDEIDFQPLEAGIPVVNDLMGSIIALGVSVADVFSVFTNALGNLFTDGLAGAGNALKVGLSQLLSKGFNSVIPGLGALAAPLIGAIASLFSGLFERANAAQHAAEQFGYQLSEALADQIDSIAQQFGGNLDAALRFSLDAVIKELGVNTLGAFEDFVTKVHQTLSSLDDGFLSGAQTIDAMGRSIEALIPSMTAVGASAMDFQTIFSDLITRANSGLLDMNQVTGLIEDALRQMADAGVEGVSELVAWLASVGIELDGVAASGAEVVSMWQQWAADVGVSTEELGRHNRKYWEDLATEMGLTGETWTAFVEGNLRQQRQAHKEHDRELRDMFRQQADELGMTEEQKKEFVRANMRQVRQERREAEREERKERRDTEKEVIESGKLVKDRLTQFYGLIRDKGIEAAQAIGAAFVQSADDMVAAWAWAQDETVGHSSIIDISREGVRAARDLEDAQVGAAHETARAWDGVSGGNVVAFPGAEMSRRAPMMGGSVSITVNVNGTDDPRAVAQEVKRVLLRELETRTAV